MKFGVMFANVGPFGQAEGLVHLAQTAERVGIESLWTVEHVVVPKGYRSPYPYAESGKMPGPEESPIPDPLVWLGYAAAVTRKITADSVTMLRTKKNTAMLAIAGAISGKRTARSVRIFVAPRHVDVSSNTRPIWPDAVVAIRYPCA